MPIWSVGLCPASARCAPAAATSAWQVTPPCLPVGRLCMQPRASAPAGESCSNRIPTGPARCSAAMAAVRSTKTALSAAAPIFVPKPVACTRANTSQTSSSASKPSMNASAAVVPARSKLRSVMRWRKCNLRERHNHAPASDWPRTALPTGRGPRRRSAACAGPHGHRPGAQTLP